jgi:hypothetical protein
MISQGLRQTNGGPGAQCKGAADTPHSNATAMLRPKSRLYPGPTRTRDEQMKKEKTRR